MMTDLECARHISQALLNLPEDYPYKNEANEAFGQLILSQPKLRGKWIVKLPYGNNKFTLLIEPKPLRVVHIVSPHIVRKPK